MNSVSMASVIAWRTRSSWNFGCERFMPNGIPPLTTTDRLTWTSGLVVSSLFKSFSVDATE